VFWVIDCKCVREDNEIDQKVNEFLIMCFHDSGISRDLIRLVMPL
jgi:hypothetical protein